MNKNILDLSGGQLATEGLLFLFYFFPKTQGPFWDASLVYEYVLLFVFCTLSFL